MTTPQQPPTGPLPGWSPPPRGWVPPRQPGWAPPQPAWGPPQPGWGPPPGWPPAPPRRRRSRWLTVGLPVGGGLVVLTGIVTAVVLLVSSVGNAIGPARDAADGFAAALVDHRWDDAQAMLCGLDRVVPAEELAAHYGDPAPTGYAIDGVQVFTGGGRTTAQVQLVLRTADGLSTRETLPLLREDGTWRPCP